MGLAIPLIVECLSECDQPRVRAGVPVLVALALLTACSPKIEEYEERGDRYSAQGDYVDAQAEYDLALEAAGDDPPGHLRMKAAALALQSKNFSEANRLFVQLLSDDGSYEDRVLALYHLHAQRWTAIGDTFAALQAIQWIQERDSTANLGTLYFTLGDAYFARPDYDAAVGAYLLGLARAADQAPPEVYARLGDAYERKRHCPAAVKYFETFLAEASADEELIADARYRLGSCALRLAERAFTADDFEGAQRYLEIVLSSGEPVSRLDEADLLQARLWERLGNRGRAMEQYRRVVDRSPDKSSRAAVEAYRRLMQLEFGLPLETAEAAARRREREAASQRRSGGER
jgi:tetratricopeptide (TPR) repeat protein